MLFTFHIHSEGEELSSQLKPLFSTLLMDKSAASKTRAAVSAHSWKSCLSIALCHFTIHHLAFVIMTIDLLIFLFHSMQSY